MNKPPCQGLYAITDALLIPDGRLLDAVEQALLGGARLIQYRDKSGDAARRLTQARMLNALCQRYQIPLIINDDVELAAEVGAAGVHLGKDDPALTTARTRLGENALIGVSCYNRLDLALAAEQAGADHVAFGAIFPSPTKPTEIRASIALLREARAALRIPIVAIGGITPDNAPLLLDVGADALAVVSGVFGQPDIRAAAARYATLFIPPSP
ncbi:MAG TPA: thiamine phosphate synthase [Candidatus Competibacteraceae bacterium]|nr:thiamine phosphate synthase [Candidatus Competibacteraceae bacterium]HRZ07020.1 thiamine phosphate synthase [Candidatus Competibacteraceae bacterium]HSA45876.1 thiamine phosphate synthase [Candidatus Competibacteraceae bacterium]